MSGGLPGMWRWGCREGGVTKGREETRGGNGCVHYLATVMAPRGYTHVKTY